MQVLEDCGPDRDGEGEHERQQAKRSRKRRAIDGIIHALASAPEATEAPAQRIRKRLRTKTSVLRETAVVAPCVAAEPLTPFEKLRSRAHESHRLAATDSLAYCRRCGAMTSLLNGRLIILAKPCNGVPNARGKANLEALARGRNPLEELRLSKETKAAKRASP